MLAYYEKIINILKRCKTVEITQAEQQMKNLALQDLQVLACLQQCLKDVTLDSSLKTIATSHINSIFVTNITEYTQQFCLKYFKQLLSDPAIAMKNKKELSRALMYCIEQCDKEHLDMWKHYTYDVILDRSQYQVGLILLTGFCCSEIRYNILQELDERVFPFIMQILCQNLKCFDQHNTIKILQIYQIWKIAGQYLLHYCPQIATKMFSKWARNQKFILSLQFVYKQLSTGKGAHFLYLDQQTLYQQINEIKRMALQLHLLILDHLLARYSKVYQTNLYQFTGLSIEVFVNTLCYVNYCENFRQQYDQEQALIFMLKIVHAMCSHTPQILCRSWKSMLHYLVFPFLSISEEERNDFQDNTNSFVQVNQDCCEKQKMGILKTEAAKFLQKIADSSQRIQKQTLQMDSDSIQKIKTKRQQAFVTKYIINFAIASIKHNLQMQFIDKNQFFQISQYQIPDSVKILSVEAAFLVLSIFSYCIDYYKKQLESIRVILCSDRTASLPPLERTRIYAFLAYNYEEVFGLIHIKSLKFWLNLALKEQSHPTVSYCALDFFTNSLNNYYDEDQIRCIISKIVTNKSPNFWPMIKKIIMQHLFKFSQNLLLSLVGESLRRIEIQVSNLHSQKIKMTFIITALLQVLKIISEKGQFIQEKHQLRKMLWEASKLYKISIDNYFEKEIVSIINCFLYYATKQQIEHPQMSGFIIDFIKDFIKSDYSPTYYYIAFNNYIMKCEYQTIIRPILIALNQSLNFFLGPLSSQANRKKIPLAHTLLLLQNIMALHGQKIPLMQINFIRQMVKSLYPKRVQIRKNNRTKTKLTIYDRTLLSRALNLELLCHMFDSHQPTITTIQKYVHLKIYYGYDVSVILTCLQILIRKQLRIDKLVQLLQFAITVIYMFMEVQIEVKIQKINQEQKKQKKRLEYDDDSDGYKIDQEEDQDKQNKKSAMLIRIKKITDYQSILAFIDTPFLKNEKKLMSYNRGVKSLKDIRIEFVHMLMELYNSNPALIQSIVNGFSEEMRHRLQVISENKVEDVLAGGNFSLVGLEGVKAPRKKYVVRKVKQGHIEDVQNTQNYQFSEQQIKRRKLHETIDQPENEQQKQLTKRNRAQKKRKQKQNIQ